MRVKLADRDVTLKLTLRALAEISDKTQTQGPSDLAAVFRALDTETVGDIVQACSEDNVALGDKEIAQLFPYVSTLFQEAFCA